jgi:hypothetical protein
VSLRLTDCFEANAPLTVRVSRQQQGVPAFIAPVVTLSRGSVRAATRRRGERHAVGAASQLTYGPRPSVGIAQQVLDEKDRRAFRDVQ